MYKIKINFSKAFAKKIEPLFKILNYIESEYGDRDFYDLNDLDLNLEYDQNSDFYSFFTDDLTNIYIYDHIFNELDRVLNGAYLRNYRENVILNSELKKIFLKYFPNIINFNLFMESINCTELDIEPNN